jgi:three-Cys-motif partner protein
MELELRKTQTRVKHTILSKYLDKWTSIIFNGLLHQAKLARSQGRAFDLHFVYVDCFSYLGRYAGELEDAIQNRQPQLAFGSPIIGIQALDKLVDYGRTAGVEVRVNAILIEQDAEKFRELLRTLNIAGLKSRVRETTNFTNLANGEIAVINSNAIELSQNLLSYTTSGYTWAFYLLDPHGPSGIPYDFVQSIVKQNHHDVMINFMYEDLIRKAGMILSENLEPKHQQLVENWTNAFGSEQWKEVVKITLQEIREHRSWRDDVLWGVPLDDMNEEGLLTDKQLAELKERRLVNLYRNVLRNMDPQLAVKLVNLQFPDKERTMFYLFLTTHDATGALSLNKILEDAKYLEYELRYRFRIAKKVASPDQLPLISVEPHVPAPIGFSRPTIEEIADDIMQRLRNQAVDRRGVYRELADEIYFPDEVDKALKLLRSTGQASYNNPLQHSTKISFSKI